MLSIIKHVKKQLKDYFFYFRGRCENLVEEYEYMFRVLAVNKGGRGHPGPPSQSVIAMYKNIPPSIKVKPR